MLMKNKIDFGKTKFSVILPLLLVFSLPIWLVLYKPILFPFADDWLVIGWNYSEKSLVDINSLQLINGHQIFLSKVLIHVLGLISASDIQLISLVTVIMGLIGIFCLVQSQIVFLGEKTNIVFVFSAIIIAANYKQMQNFFMPICNGWMMAIFFIGIYYWLKQKQDFRAKKYLTGTTIILAPLTIGLGIIIPIIEIVEISYKAVLRERFNSVLKKNLFTLVTSVFSLIFFLLIPLLQLGDGSGFISNRNLGNIFNLIEYPGGSLMFLFTLIGNIFVPASRFDPIIPAVAGGLFLTISVLLLRRNYSKIKIDDIFLNRNCTLGGVIFLFILFFFRYSGKPSEIQVVAAPRYVTGSLIFIIGILGLIQKISDKRKVISLFLLITSSLTLISGLKTGLEWHATRYKQSQILIECAENKNSVGTKFAEGQPCFTLAYENSMSPSKDFFKLELQKFIENINDR